MATARQGYDALARVFHWITALLIIALFALGWYMVDLDNADPEKFRLYQIHKSIGITVLLLAILRLAWRFVHSPPPWPSHMAPWERMAAAGAHWALYGLILLQPVLGILQSNAANFPIVLWGGVELPALLAPSPALEDVFLSAHHLLANVLAGLVLLHVAAALRHHIQLKDDVLRNMLPSSGVGIGVAVLAIALLLPPFLLIRSSGPAATASGSEMQTTAVAGDDGDTEKAEVPGDSWTIEEGSTLGFIALQQGSEVPGSFDIFDAVIVFDPDDLENSRIDVDIDVTSINTGQKARDDTLNSPSFFDTATWPSAAFKSRIVTATGEGQYEAAGTLTIRDVTKDAVLPFSLTIQADPEDPARERAEAIGELPILRLDYGVGQGDWSSTGTVADEVVITIDIDASKPVAGSSPSG
ncbi:MAG: cytochrome b/b6 domain-containing protein [Geminicoccaceae bacterium]